MVCATDAAVRGRCKLHCKSCGCFLGFAQADGSLPYADDCPGGRAGDKCPVLSELQGNQPLRQRPTGLGGGSGGPLDPDAGSYRSIAVRALEDAGHDLEEAGVK